MLLLLLLILFLLMKRHLHAASLFSNLLLDALLMVINFGQVYFAFCHLLLIDIRIVITASDDASFYAVGFVGHF